MGAHDQVYLEDTRGVAEITEMSMMCGEQQGTVLESKWRPRVVESEVGNFF